MSTSAKWGLGILVLGLLVLVVLGLRRKDESSNPPSSGCTSCGDKRITLDPIETALQKNLISFLA